LIKPLARVSPNGDLFNDVNRKPIKQWLHGKDANINWKYTSDNSVPSLSEISKPSIKRVTNHRNEVKLSTHEHDQDNRICEVHEQEALSLILDLKGFCPEANLLTHVYDEPSDYHICQEDDHA